MPWLLVQANALRIPLPDASVHCVVTSPPYWGLRDYAVADQLGLEPTPEAYVTRLVEVFREVRRTLRDDGTLWLNLGDSYNSSSQHNHGKGGAMEHRHLAPKNGWAGHQPLAPGLKPKDMVGIPWKTAFALQADGWYMRSDIVWAKPNPMPESVTDRPTKSHEYVFLLSKRPTYYFDAEAVRENGTGNQPWGTKRKSTVSGPVGKQPLNGDGHVYAETIAGRNIRTVWTIPTRSYAGAHFATFPPRLVEPCIKAGTSERGCCPECGAPWKREMKRTAQTPTNWQCPPAGDPTMKTRPKNRNGQNHAAWKALHPDVDLGWSPTCAHRLDPVPCLVLDPFAGSGTTLVVAEALGRHGIGLDISREYLTKQAKRRLERPHARAIRPTQTEPDLPLFRR